MKDLAKFFLKLDINPIWSQQYRSQVIMQYQEKAQRNWTASIREGNPYSIAKINDNLLTLGAKGNIPSGYIVS